MASSDARDVLAAFPRERQWLLPALHAIQEARGWLPEDALAAAADHLRVPASEVHGVATHYPELRLRARGRHHVRVCAGVSCALLGGRDLLAAVARRYGVTPGVWSADSPVSLEAADCFFECSVGPLAEIDGALHGRLTLVDVARVERWFAGHAAAAEPVGGAASPPRPVLSGLPGPGATQVGSRVTASVVEEGTLPRRPRSAGSAQEALAGLVRAAEARSSSRPALRLLVQMGTCSRAVGGAELHAALRAEVERRGAAVEVVEGSCNGACWAAPSVEVSRAGWPRVMLERVTVDRAPVLVDLLAGEGGDFAAAGFGGVAWSETAWRGLGPVAAHPFWRDQTRVLLGRAGAIDPGRLDDALLHGAYRALAAALDGPPPAVIDAVKASGLQGRGGAFFPAALKWEACRNAGGQPKYVVMNGEEGEPGIFKDRHLMEGDPHRLLEGVLLAAYASGAGHAILYVHGEADLSARRLAKAVDQARAAGLVGERVLGTDFGCEVELRRGAGGFVLGEETALLESIEGRRAQPRTRPPFPVEAGLWGRPTVINNVETLAAVPAILTDGPDRSGTKLFGLSGPVVRPGVVEMGRGTTLGRLVRDIAGGALGGRPMKGAVVGGPSGSVVPAALFDVAMEPRGQVSPGTGGIVAVPEDASVVEIVTTLVGFNAAESCGKCTPCREGLPRLLAMIDELPASPGVEARALALAEAIQLASLCGLGQAAPASLLRGLQDFGDDFRRGHP